MPVEYRGELVALVSGERFHIVSARLAERPPGDAELRFVALMCACWGRALADGLACEITAWVVEESTRRMAPGSSTLRHRSSSSPTHPSQGRP